MAETNGYWDNKGDPATKATWANPTIVPVEKRSSGGWYYNPESGNVDRWWSGTKQTTSTPATTTNFTSTPDTAEQLPSYLQDFQETALKSLSELKPAEVPTFEELKNNLTPDTPAPTPISRVAARQEMMGSLGVVALESELNTIKTEETKITDELRALTGTEEGKPVAMNVISGRITEEQRVAQQRLDAVIRQKNSVINELNTKYNIINTYVTDLGLDYQDAVTAYNTEFDRNYKVQSMVTDMASKSFEQTVSLIKTGFDITMDTAKFAQTIKQANIDNARANLTTMTNAITSGNMSYDQLSSDQKLQIQKLEIQSGLPVGTMSSMGLSAKDKVLAFSSDNSQAWVIGDDGKMKVISTGLTPKSDSTSGEKLTTAQLKTDANSMNYPDLINKYAGVADIDTIKRAYMAGAMGKKWGSPTEDPYEVSLLYKVAKGEISAAEAREKLAEYGE